VKSRALGLLLGWALLLSPHQARAASKGGLSVARYAQEIHLIRRQLDAVSRAHAVSPAAIRSIQYRLRRLERVRLPDGAVLATNTVALALQLSEHNQRVNQRVSQQVDALDSTLRGPHRAVSPGMLRALDTVLREPKFHEQCQNLDCELNWLGRQLQTLLDRLSLGRDTSAKPAVKLLFGALFLILVGAIAVLAARGALRRLVVDLPAPATNDQGMNEQAARRRADHLVAAGDYRVALRYLFIATMLELQRRGALILQPGLTNREYVAAIRAGKLAPKETEQPLRQLVEEFDRFWYGHLPFGPGDYQRCVALARQAVQGLETTSAA